MLQNSSQQPKHGIKCDLCSKWVHLKCNKLDKKNYVSYQTQEMDFFCIKCIADTLPLLNLDNNQFELTAKGIKVPEEIDMNEMFLSVSQLNIIKKINEAVGSGFDVGNDTEIENEAHPIDCKYYTIEQLNNGRFNSIKHFSILHLNIHSLDFHIEELRLALKLINLKFDFVCITESKIIKNVEPKSNINIEHYHSPVGTPTESSKGGVLIYVKEGIDFKPREDLNIYKTKDLESYFLETINEKGRNTIIATIYRHPCMEPKTFIDNYLQPLNDQLIKENKKIFLGDFNFDLIIYPLSSLYQETIKTISQKNRICILVKQNPLIILVL